MREMLVPIFGETGAVVAQFVLTLVIVLVLVGAVVWLVRRYGNGAFGGVSRSRAPRLALVDALAVDGRRRLVLVRRDNVEHLILIGGPTDIVVEPTIVRGVSAAVRQRPGQGQPAMRPAAQPSPAPQSDPRQLVEAAPPPPAPQSQAPQPAPVPPPAAMRPAPAPPPPMPRRMPAHSEPIPFPQPQRGEDADVDLSAPPAILRRAAARPASGHFAETSRPTRIESVFSLADALDDIADEAPAEPASAAAAPAAAAPPAAAAAAPAEEEPLPEYLSPLADDEPAPATAAEEIAEGPPTAGGSASRVSDLEREMARLLGEITAKRGG